MVSKWLTFSRSAPCCPGPSKSETLGSTRRAVNRPLGMPDFVLGQSSTFPQKADIHGVSRISAQCQEVPPAATEVFVTMKCGHPAQGRGRPSQPCPEDSSHTSS